MVNYGQLTISVGELAIFLGELVGSPRALVRPRPKAAPAAALKEAQAKLVEEEAGEPGSQ